MVDEAPLMLQRLLALIVPARRAARGIVLRNAATRQDLPAAVHCLEHGEARRPRNIVE